MNCGNEMKWRYDRRSETQFKQLRKEAWKKIQDFNGVWTRDLAIPVRCSTIFAMLYYFFSGFFTQLLKLRFTATIIPSFHFISAVHIWFISYIINTHFFHGNIWTHNWPAPNVSGFIAQLVEHRTGIARSRVQTPLKSWIFFFQASLRNCLNCVSLRRSYLHFISFPQFIYDSFHISLTLISFTGTYEPIIDLLPTSVAS